MIRTGVPARVIDLLVDWLDGQGAVPTVERTPDFAIVSGTLPDGVLMHLLVIRPGAGDRDGAEGYTVLAREEVSAG